MKRAKRERRYAQNRNSHPSHIGNRWLFASDTGLAFVFRASPGAGSPAAAENPAGAETTLAAGSQEGAAASPQAPALPVEAAAEWQASAALRRAARAAAHVRVDCPGNADVITEVLKKKIASCRRDVKKSPLL